MPDLIHALWWHVYPLGACGAAIRPGQGDEEWAGDRLRRLITWLDYAVDLGCNGLLLGPVFASGTHGYDTLDHFRLDPRLGDEETWAEFVREAHRRGLLIMLDGVFNHVGAGHDLVQRAQRGEGMVRIVDGRPADWEGHTDLAELDHTDPRVADLVSDVMTFWLDRGADGWRLDVAYAVPAVFWAAVLGRVRAHHPDAVFLGEMIHGDYPGAAQAATWDTATAYELWKAIWSSIHDRNFWELAWALERHDGFSSQVMLNTFVGNHDVTRIASAIGDEGAALAAILLLTLPGMPSIYYGDEQAFRGDKGTGAGADDALRQALPERPDLLDPAGWWLYRLHQDLIGLRRRNAWLANARVSVLDKTNTTLSYAVRGSGHELIAAVDITGEPRAHVTVDGAAALAWPR